jgi:hypothetical protein
MNNIVLVASTVIMFGLFLFYYKKSNVAPNRYYEQKQTDVGYWNYIYIIRLRETIRAQGNNFSLDDVQQYDAAYFIGELRKRMLESFSDKNAVDEYITLISKLVYSYANKRGDILLLKNQLQENAKKLVQENHIGDWQEHLNMMYVYMESNGSQKIIDAVNRSVRALRTIDTNI